MQGLVNFSTTIADGIAVLLPSLCYLAACSCFFFAAWTFRGLTHHHHHHHHWQRPWVPWVSLVLTGVFATFPQFVNKLDVSAGSLVVASLTTYTASTPGSAASILGAAPTDTVINVVKLFQRFFQMFGAACVFFAVLRWRQVINGLTNGSPLACGIQLTFGVLCINILTIANGVVAMFTTGG